MTKENSIEKEKMALLQEKDPIALFLRINNKISELQNKIRKIKQKIGSAWGVQ